jgi:hypothetical protein
MDDPPLLPELTRCVSALRLTLSESLYAPRR